MPRLWMLAFLFAVTLHAQWSQFRGSNGTGVADSSKLPVDFGPGKNVVWRTELPPGHSSPVIFGDRIFVTAADPTKPVSAGGDKVADREGKLYTICLDRRTGKILWKREAPRPRFERYQLTNSVASPSPVTDGRTVYVFFGDFGILAYDFEGTERWRLPLGPFNNMNGHGSSPILVDNLLILLCDQDSDSYLLALDKETGRQRWKTPRPEFTRAYTTPSVLRPARGPVELIVIGAFQLTSYDVRTGEKLWWIDGMSWHPKATPLIDGDMIYAHSWESGGDSETVPVTATYDEMLAKFDANHDRKISVEELAPDRRLQNAHANIDLDHSGAIDARDWEIYRAKRAARNSLIAVRHGGRGDLTMSSNIVWRLERFLPNAPSPLIYKGALYLVKDGGILTSLHPKTGEIIKQGRLPNALDTYYASPVAGAGHIYVVSQSGKMTVIKAAGQWEVVASADFDEECFATPAIAGDSLYVRTKVALYCFREQ